MKKGFTLIELLIVVAIIAILAAIAIPNFLQAQVRAKVSRVKADMRSAATAIEMYAVDNNVYPSHKIRNGGYPFYLTTVLTSPVAYLSDVNHLYDAFRVQESTHGDFSKRFRYLNYQEGIDHHDGNPWIEPAFPNWRPDGVTSRENWEMGKMRFGGYKISSAGPDGVINSGASFYYDDLSYDPTNGTISGGDIIRSPIFQSP